MGIRGSSNSSRSSSFVRPKGRLATTRNGSCGSLNVAASHSMTSTFGQRPRSVAASAGSSSTATTRRATRASSDVSRPRPAPMSTTRSAAISAVRRKCWLRGGADRALRARRPATEDLEHRHRHGQQSIRRAGAVAGGSLSPALWVDRFLLARSAVWLRLAVPFAQRVSAKG